MTDYKKNPLLATDVYKMGHMEQYAPHCTKVYSYLMARNSDFFDHTVFFGLQYYLKEYFSIPLTPEMGEEFLTYRKIILGYNSPNVELQIRSLCELGYFPLEIKTIEEGTIIPTKNVLLTITNTQAEFYWVVGFVESLLLKIWYPITVATCCYNYRKVIEKYFSITCTQQDEDIKDFMVHDFGYRGDKSEDAAAISGAAHLTVFLGSDTVVALPFLQKYYHAKLNEINMLSVPASEHSVMSSFGQHNEIEAFKHMLNLYPKGIVSIVSDTYDIFKVLSEFALKLKPQILAREGKTVFRPDSGNPEYVICGNPHAPVDSREYKGALRLLEEVFGSTTNDKGYKVLHEKVGLIYGDAMYLQRYENILATMQKMGFAASNLVIGVGRYLRDFNRDTLGFALKATYIEINGEPRLIDKSPITDKNKKSHKGLLCLENKNDNWVTTECCSQQQELSGLLKTVWKNGKLLQEHSIQTIRERIKTHLTSTTVKEK